MPHWSQQRMSLPVRHMSGMSTMTVGGARRQGIKDRNQATSTACSVGPLFLLKQTWTRGERVGSDSFSPL